MMTGLESLIRLAAVCLMAGVALPSMQAQVRARTEQAMAQMFQAQDLSFPIDEARVPTHAQAPLPTVHVSQALYARLVSASSP